MMVSAVWCSRIFVLDQYYQWCSGFSICFRIFYRNCRRMGIWGRSNRFSILG